MSGFEASRRAFLGLAPAVGTLTLGGLDRVLAAVRALGPAAANDPLAAAADEEFWREVQESFDVDRSLVNLNNGGVSPSPRVVMDALRRHLEFSNGAPCYTMWRILEPQIETVRQKLARELGCDSEEVAITRNASESLETVIFGIPLERGDEIIDVRFARLSSHSPYSRVSGSRQCPGDIRSFPKNSRA